MIETQEILERHVYVGFANIDKLMIQYQKRLLMVNARVWIKAWLYQTAVNNFGHFDLYQIQPPIEVLLVLNRSNTKEVVSLDVFEKQRKFLKQELGISIEDGKLLTLPVLLAQLPPYPTRLGNLLKEIGEIMGVEQSETDQARKLLGALAEYYSRFFEYYYVQSSKGNKMDIISNIYRAHMWEDIRRQMYATEELDKEREDLISTEKLYTIFERC